MSGRTNFRTVHGMRSPRASLWWWYSGVLLLIVAGAAVALLHGADQPDVVGEDELDEPASVPVPVPVPATGAFGVAQGQSVVSPPRGGSSPPISVAAPQIVDPTTQRMVRSAAITLDLPAGGFAAAFDRVAVLATQHGGLVVSSTSESRGSGQLVVRVPVARFDAAREAIAGLGKVASQALRGDDVGGQLVDQEARVRSLQAEEEALRSLVGKATTVGEVLQVQPTLFSVRQQIEQLQAQRANLEQAAALATISVGLYEPGARSAAPTPDQNALRQRLEQAGDGAVSVVGGMIVIVGWLAPVAALGLAGLVVVRARNRRRSVAVT